MKTTLSDLKGLILKASQLKQNCNQICHWPENCKKLKKKKKTKNRDNASGNKDLE